MNSIWVKSSLFEEGVLPYPIYSSLSEQSILKCTLDYLESLKNRKITKNPFELSHTEWIDLARETFHFPPELSLLYVTLYKTYFTGNMPSCFKEDNPKFISNLDMFFMFLVFQFFYKNTYKKMLKNETFPSTSSPRSPLSPHSFEHSLRNQSYFPEAHYQTEFLKKRAGVLCKIALMFHNKHTNQRIKHSFCHSPDLLDRFSFFFDSEQPLRTFWPRFADNDNESVNLKTLEKWLKEQVSINETLYPLSTEFASAKQIDPSVKFYHSLRKETVVFPDPATIKAGTRTTTGALRTVSLVNCTKSFFYLLDAFRRVSIVSCKGGVIFVGSCAGIISVENCQNITLVSCSSMLRISHCENCIFYSLTNYQPLLINKNFFLSFAPYKTTYPYLLRHLQAAGIDPTCNAWNRPLILSHLLRQDAGTSKDPQSEEKEKEKETHEFSIRPPHLSISFSLPFEMDWTIKDATFQPPLDDAYINDDQILSMKDALKQIFPGPITEEKTKEIHKEFNIWLEDTGNIHHIKNLQSMGN